MQAPTRGPLRLGRLEAHRDSLEHSSGRGSIAHADAIQCFGNRRFYGALAHGIRADAAPGQAEDGAPPIPWIVRACQEVAGRRAAGGRR
jgi:hypothetical protein